MNWKRIGAFSTIIGALAGIISFACDFIDDKVDKIERDEEIAKEVKRQINLYLDDR